MIRAILTLTAVLALAACGGIPSVEVPKEVKVSVPVPCISQDKRPKNPGFFADGELDAMADYHWALAMESDRVRARDYIRELEAVVDGCSRIPQPVKPAVRLRSVSSDPLQDVAHFLEQRSLPPSMVLNLERGEGLQDPHDEHEQAYYERNELHDPSPMAAGKSCAGRGECAKSEIRPVQKARIVNLS